MISDIKSVTLATVNMFSIFFYLVALSFDPTSHSIKIVIDALSSAGILSSNRVWCGSF